MCLPIARAAWAGYGGGMPDTAPRPSPSASATRPQLTPEMQALLDTIAREEGNLPDPTTLPATEGRALSAKKSQRWQVDQPPMAEVLDREVPSDPALRTPAVPVRIFRPENAKPGAIVHAHGGGFAFGSNRSHERLMRLLARDSGRPVVGVEYRLAPENPYPAGVLDVVAALRAVSRAPGDFGAAAGPVVISGDSAGATLALAALLHEVDAPDAHLAAGGLLFFGSYAADFTTPSYRDFATGYGLTTATMQRYWDWYVPDHARRAEPLASPLLASGAALASLPPLHLVVAEVDPLASDTYALKERLTELGRNDEMHVERGVTHGYVQMTAHLAVARAAVAAAARAADRFIEAAAAAS